MEEFSMATHIDYDGVFSPGSYIMNDEVGIKRMNILHCGAIALCKLNTRLYKNLFSVMTNKIKVIHIVSPYSSSLCLSNYRKNMLQPDPQAKTSPTKKDS
jgi:hypothetical protein